VKAWLLLLSGLLIWAVHFFGIYIIGSLLPGAVSARWLAAALTLACLAAVGFFISLLVVRQLNAHDDTDRWGGLLGLSGCGLSLAAIGLQAMPAILG
jgi:hypothetical protein